MKESGGRTLQTTSTSLDVLETVVQKGGATAMELVEELDLSHSTVHNHLSTLVQRGYLTGEANTYYAGAKFCQVGDQVRQSKPAYVIAGEVVAELAERTELDADFSVEENGYVISLYNGLRATDSAHFLNAGQFFYVHSSASGKAILAEYPRERVERLLDLRGMPRRTENTVTSREALFEELEAVRERGYAVNEEEALEGLWAVGKAVKDPFGEVVGSLNLSGPLYLHSPDVRQPAVDLLEEMVTEFEDRIESRFAELSRPE